MNNNNTKQPQVNQPLRRGGRMGGMFSGAKEKPKDLWTSVKRLIKYISYNKKI